MFSKEAKQQPNKPQSRIESLIGAGTRVEGNIRFSGGLRVDGEVVGNIESTGDKPSTLVVSEQARVEGAVVVAHLVVNGTISGPVKVSGSLELQPAARVTGDVEYNLIEMQQGAIVEGRLVHAASSKAVELKLASSSV